MKLVTFIIFGTAGVIVVVALFLCFRWMVTPSAPTQSDVIVRVPSAKVATPSQVATAHSDEEMVGRMSFTALFRPPTLVQPNDLTLCMGALIKWTSPADASGVPYDAAAWPMPHDELEDVITPSPAQVAARSAPGDAAITNYCDALEKGIADKTAPGALVDDRLDVLLAKTPLRCDDLEAIARAVMFVEEPQDRPTGKINMLAKPWMVAAVRRAGVELSGPCSDERKQKVLLALRRLGRPLIETGDNEDVITLFKLLTQLEAPRSGWAWRARYLEAEYVMYQNNDAARAMELLEPVYADSIGGALWKDSDRQQLAWLRGVVLDQNHRWAEAALSLNLAMTAPKFEFPQQAEQMEIDALARSGQSAEASRRYDAFVKKYTVSAADALTLQSLILENQH